MGRTCPSDFQHSAFAAFTIESTWVYALQDVGRNDPNISAVDGVMHLRCGQEEGQHVDSLAIRVWAAGYASTAHSNQMNTVLQPNATTGFCLIQTETGLNSNVEKGVFLHLFRHYVRPLNPKLVSGRTESDWPETQLWVSSRTVFR